MPIATIETTRRYTDLDLDFKIHPVKKDIVKLNDERAVIGALKNLILLNYYEKPFHPEIGSNIRKLLFEPMDVINATALSRQIEEVIRNYEPRVLVTSINVSPNFPQNQYDITMEFTIRNRVEPITISFNLRRIR